MKLPRAVLFLVAGGAFFCLVKLLQKQVIISPQKKLETEFSAYDNFQRGGQHTKPSGKASEKERTHEVAAGVEDSREASGTSGKGTGPGRRVPLIFHQIFRDENLPAPYMMCLTGLLRHHRIRNPNSPVPPKSMHFIADSDEEFDYYFWSDQTVSGDAYPP